MIHQWGEAWCQRCLKMWFLCSSEATPLTGGNKFGDKTWNNVLSRNIWCPFWGLTPVLQMNRRVSFRPAHTSLYQQLVTFLNAKARGVCSNQSDNRNGLVLHKVQSDEGQAAFIPFGWHVGLHFRLQVQPPGVKSMDSEVANENTVYLVNPLHAVSEPCGDSNSFCLVHVWNKWHNWNEKYC